MLSLLIDQQLTNVLIVQHRGVSASTVSKQATYKHLGNCVVSSLMVCVCPPTALGIDRSSNHFIEQHIKNERMTQCISVSLQL